MKAEGAVHRCPKCHGYYRFYSFMPALNKDCTKHDPENYVLKNEYDIEATFNKNKYGKM